MGSGSSHAELDFASVQRDNPEMQRRCQEVIDHCWALGADNPITSIHDCGAGGLSNALPELLNDSCRGGLLELRQVPNADLAMSPMQIWCNESQERYVLSTAAARLGEFIEICERERCPYAVLGTATGDGHLRVDDRLFNDAAVDLPLEVLFGAPDVDAKALLAEMWAFAPEWLVGCALRECWFEPTFHKHAGKLCTGLQIHVEDPVYYDHETFQPWRVQALAFKALRKLRPDYDLWRDFEYEYEHERLAIDLIGGSELLRQWVDDVDASPSDLDALAKPDEAAWSEERETVMLY